MQRTTIYTLEEIYSKIDAAKQPTSYDMALAYPCIIEDEQGDAVFLGTEEQCESYREAKPSFPKMGVPITFIDKYCPFEFKIIDSIAPSINGKKLYKRIIIRYLLSGEIAAIILNLQRKAEWIPPSAYECFWKALMREDERRREQQ